MDGWALGGLIAVWVSRWRAGWIGDWMGKMSDNLYSYVFKQKCSEPMVVCFILYFFLFNNNKKNCHLNIPI